MAAPIPQPQPVSEPVVWRFNIRWGNGHYSVDIPNYGGGELVDAPAFDALRARVEELEKLIDFIAERTDAPDNSADVTAWAAMLYARIKDIRHVILQSKGAA